MNSSKSQNKKSSEYGLLRKKIGLVYIRIIETKQKILGIRKKVQQEKDDKAIENIRKRIQKKF